LRLLNPQGDSPTARIIAGTYGGGLLAGDAIELTVDAGPETRCILGTQASTKIYRSEGARCTQKLLVTAANDSVIVSLPDPVVCFARSRFYQHQDFELAPNASLLVLDWFTSGRAACGERWAMHHYTSQTQVTVGGQPLFRDNLELDPADGEIGGAMRMANTKCFATVIMIGPSFADRGRAMVRSIQREPIVAMSSLFFGASPLNGGAVFRVAGDNSQSVGSWLRQRLNFVPDLIGLDPWQRKW
jgi:urease accessory protein